jgi:hypothetical protein
VRRFACGNEAFRAGLGANRLIAAIRIGAGEGDPTSQFLDDWFGEVIAGHTLLLYMAADTLADTFDLLNSGAARGSGDSVARPKIGIAASGGRGFVRQVPTSRKSAMVVVRSVTNDSVTLQLRLPCQLEPPEPPIVCNASETVPMRVASVSQVAEDHTLHG